jgi:hypothetical protein
MTGFARSAIAPLTSNLNKIPLALLESALPEPNPTGIDGVESRENRANCKDIY